MNLSIAANWRKNLMMVPILIFPDASVHFVVAQVGPGLEHEVNCDFYTAPIFCKLIFSFLTCSILSCFCLLAPDQCALLRSAFEVNSSRHSSLSSVNCNFTFCQRLSFGFFPWLPAAFHLVLCSGFPVLP